MEKFDVVIIGAGPVGENVGDYARQGGLSVAVVESELVGGECSYWACIPSKALLRPVQALAAANRVGGARAAVVEQPDVPATLARRDSFVSGYDDSGQAKWVKEAGLTLVRGHGRLAGERRVVVQTDDGEVELQARLGVVVCTGTEANVPPIPGLAGARPWTSREATGMREVPARLAVIGGGVVACEMATAVAGLGAEQVTMVVRDDRLLTGVQPFASEFVLDGLHAHGVDVRFGSTVAQVSREDGDDAPVTLRLHGGGNLEADEVLVAAGRNPRTSDLGLETVGLELGEPLTTDDALAVNGVPGGWLFAVGDVNGRAPLTHQGKYQARLLADRLAAQSRGEEPETTSRWGRYTPTADTEAVPQVIFTDPQVAMVGLTEQQAKDRGVQTQMVEYDLGNIAGAALHADGYAGRAAMLIDVDREVILGVTFVGQDVAELLHAATIAVVGEVPIHRLWHAVPAFPTISEIWLRLLEEWRTAPSR